MIMTCQCSSILGNKCTPLVSVVNGGGLCVGIERIWETSVLYIFCCEPKIALKTCLKLISTGK